MDNQTERIKTKDMSTETMLQYSSYSLGSSLFLSTCSVY